MKKRERKKGREATKGTPIRMLGAERQREKGRKEEETELTEKRKNRKLNGRRKRSLRQRVKDQQSDDEENVTA